MTWTSEFGAICDAERAQKYKQQEQMRALWVEVYLLTLKAFHNLPKTDKSILAAHERAKEAAELSCESFLEGFISPEFNGKRAE